MRGIAFVGGEGPAPRVLQKIAAGADILVAADSGLIACEAAGLKPDWVVGDMDSLDSESRLEKYPAEQVRRFPPDKDNTDTELALALLREKGCDELWIAGGGGGRIDHLLAIHALFESEDPPDKWFPGSEEIHCLKEGRVHNAALPPGSRVSVFPLASGSLGPSWRPWATSPWAAESFGLKWPLNGLSWEKGGMGLSNVASEGYFEIHSKRGRFLVITPMQFDDK